MCGISLDFLTDIRVVFERCLNGFRNIFPSDVYVLFRVGVPYLAHYMADIDDDSRLALVYYD
jgi:hypothetical protein